MTAKCVDAPQGLRPGLYASTCSPFATPLLQNLVQYFKLASVFSVRLKSFVIVLTSIDSCTIVHATTTVALTIYALTKQLHIISLRFIGTSESWLDVKS